MEMSFSKTLKGTNAIVFSDSPYWNHDSNCAGRLSFYIEKMQIRIKGKFRGVTKSSGFTL